MASRVVQVTMPRPKVFVTRHIGQKALDAIGAETDMEVWPLETPPPPDELKRRAANAQGLVTTIMDRVDRDLLDECRQLKVVSQMAVGVDNIDVPALTARGIPLGYTPGVLARATADLAFALLLTAARRVSETDRWVRQGNWKLAFHPMWWLGVDVGGATMGIVGLGQIGLETAKRARGFDMRVLYSARSRKTEAESQHGLEYADMASLLQESDFISLHVPLTPETRGLIGENELAVMKSTSILVNTARGPVVDSKALYEALKHGRIAGAGLDVTDPEPIPNDDPLLSLDNVVITPHIGSSSTGARQAMGMLAARNLLAGLNDHPLVHCFNPEAYEGR